MFIQPQHRSIHHARLTPVANDHSRFAPNLPESHWKERDQNRREALEQLTDDVVAAGIDFPQLKEESKDAR
jgi:hypothetical protein